MINERTLRRALIIIALAGLALGLAAAFTGRNGLARWIWAAGTIPVVAGLAISIARDFLAGRMGVDAVAFVSMAAALALGQTLAGVLVAIMYAGGSVLEDFAVGRAERDLKSLVDRAPRVAHRKTEGSFEDVPIDLVVVGDALLVRAGEVIPVDGQITSPSASLDESAVTGEPIPVTRRAGEAARSGAINAGETFEMRASATAGESTYAGIIKMVTAAQTAKAPFIRMADRFALLLLPVTLLVAGAAFRRSRSRARRARRGNALSFDPRSARGVYRRRGPGCPPQHLDQGRRPARGARPGTHGDVRQDGHFDRWRRAPGRR